MRNPSRRTLLRSGVIAVVAGLPLAGSGVALSASSAALPKGLRRAAFKPWVGTRFLLLGEDGTEYGARLARLGDLRKASRGHDKAFRLVFQMDGARPPQGTYRLTHRAMASLDLFVAPVGEHPGVYEAVVDGRR